MRKLIIFVDELDRCRPDYAIQVLECVKHFFSVDNLIFVIAIDRDALNASICTVYGDAINVDGYMRKFFDYHAEFGPPDYEAFSVLLAKSLRLEEIIPIHLGDWLVLFSSWCRSFKLPLRVQEQIFSQANFVVRSYVADKIWPIYDLVLLSLLIRARNAEVLARISAGHMGLQNMLSEVRGLVDPDAKDDELDRLIRYGVEILAAGFVGAEAMREEYRALKGQLETARNRPHGEHKTLEQVIDTLGKALEIANDLMRNQMLGPRRTAHTLFDKLSRMAGRGAGHAATREQAE